MVNGRAGVCPTPHKPYILVSSHILVEFCAKSKPMKALWPYFTTYTDFVGFHFMQFVLWRLFWFNKYKIISGYLIFCWAVHDILENLGNPLSFSIQVKNSLYLSCPDMRQNILLWLALKKVSYKVILHTLWRCWKWCCLFYCTTSPLWILVGEIASRPNHQEKALLTGRRRQAFSAADHATDCIAPYALATRNLKAVFFISP